MTRRNDSPLVGRWFHAFDADGALKWQGQVLAAVTTDLFLVHRHEWTAGGPGDQVLVPLAQMAAWAFYDTEADMHRQLLVNTDTLVRREAFGSTCLFCGGDRAAPHHARTCDGRQGHVEVQ